MSGCVRRKWRGDDRAGEGRGGETETRRERERERVQADKDGERAEKLEGWMRLKKDQREKTE